MNDESLNDAFHLNVLAGSNGEYIPTSFSTLVAGAARDCFHVPRNGFLFIALGFPLKKKL